jgi:hypothetical protein
VHFSTSSIGPAHLDRAAILPPVSARVFVNPSFPDFRTSVPVLASEHQESDAIFQSFDNETKGKSGDVAVREQTEFGAFGGSLGGSGSDAELAADGDEPMTQSRERLMVKQATEISSFRRTPTTACSELKTHPKSAVLVSDARLPPLLPSSSSAILGPFGGSPLSDVVGDAPMTSSFGARVGVVALSPHRRRVRRRKRNRMILVDAAVELDDLLQEVTAAPLVLECMTAPPYQNDEGQERGSVSVDDPEEAMRTDRGTDDEKELEYWCEDDFPLTSHSMSSMSLERSEGTDNQMIIFYVRRKCVQNGSVENALILNPSEADFARVWIPGSIAVLGLGPLKFS